MRVVLDTNVFIAALIKPGSSNDLLVQHWLGGSYTLLTSAALEELRRVSKEKRFAYVIRRGAAGKLVNRLHRFAEAIKPENVPDISPDPDDNLILAIAQAGKADYLASLDMRHVLALKKLGKTRIVHARELLEQFS